MKALSCLPVLTVGNGNEEFLDFLRSTCMQILSDLGKQHTITVYRGALALAGAQARRVVQRDVVVPVSFEGCVLSRKQADMLIDGFMLQVINETNIGVKQLRESARYMKASGLQECYIVNLKAGENAVQIKHVRLSDVQTSQPMITVS